MLLLPTQLVAFYPDKVVADDMSLVEGSFSVSGTPGEDYVANEIIVKFRPGIDTISQNDLNSALGTETIYTSPFAGFKLLHIPEGKTVAETVALYSGQSIVEYAEPNYIDRITWSPNDTAYSFQWHFTQINLEAAWDLDTTTPKYGGDSSIVVAVVDSGVAYETYGGYVQAPDLANTNFWTNSGETASNEVDDDGNGYVDDINGWDFVNSDAHPNDDNNHGTHVTGTIAQSTNNSAGVAGIAFNTTIMPIKTLNSAGSGTHANMADGYHYAADNGAHIINYSAGGSHSTTKENAVAYARNAGVVVIAAMGNDGNDTPQYPAGYNDYVIAVGSTRYDQARPSYGSYGSHMDIAAPGGDTSVDQNSDGYSDGVLQQTFASGNVTNFNYYFWQGTSMATPHVAGVAALILAKNPNWNPAQVRHALQSTATDIGTSGNDTAYGWGLLNAQAAVAGFNEHTINGSFDGANSIYATDIDGDGDIDVLGTALYADNITWWENEMTLFHSFSDSSRTLRCDSFSDYGTQHIAYMYATGLLASHGYRVAYYDGSNTRRDIDDVASSSSGNLSSQHTFVAGTDVAGGWKVIVCEPDFTPPSSYNGSWAYVITSDNFTVQDTAIPEFPTGVVVIIALSLCGGIYLWMRSKAVLAAVN